jgi:hypothetical protein
MFPTAEGQGAHEFLRVDNLGSRHHCPSASAFLVGQSESRYHLQPIRVRWI